MHRHYGLPTPSRDPKRNEVQDQNKRRTGDIMPPNLNVILVKYAVSNMFPNIITVDLRECLKIRKRRRCVTKEMPGSKDRRG